MSLDNDQIIMKDPYSVDRYFQGWEKWEVPQYYEYSYVSCCNSYEYCISPELDLTNDYMDPESLLKNYGKL